MLGVFALVGIFYALAKTRKRGIALACMAIGLFVSIVTAKVMVRPPQSTDSKEMEAFNVRLLFLLMNLFFFLVGAAVLSYGLSITTADRESWKIVTDGLLVTLVFFMMIFTGFCSSAIYSVLTKAPSSSAPLSTGDVSAGTTEANVSAETTEASRIELLHAWHTRFLLFKAFFVLLGVGVCLVNRYRVFYDTNKVKFWLEVLVMGLAGAAAGALQPLFQMNCPKKDVSHHVEHILFMTVFSIGLYCVCEFSGVNSLLAIAPAVSTVPSSTAPLSMERTLAVEFVVVMLTLSMSMLLSIFLIIASNGLGFSTFTKIEACYASSAAASVSAEQQPLLGQQKLLTVAKVKFVLHWFLWALFMNAAYIYLRLNRNPTLGLRSLNSTFWTGETDMQIKFTFVGLLIGIMSVNLDEQSYTQRFMKKVAPASTTGTAARNQV